MAILSGYKGHIETSMGGLLQPILRIFTKKVHLMSTLLPRYWDWEPGAMPRSRVLWRDLEHLVPREDTYGESLGEMLHHKISQGDCSVSSFNFQTDEQESP